MTRFVQEKTLAISRAHCTWVRPCLLEGAWYRYRGTDTGFFSVRGSGRDTGTSAVLDSGRTATFVYICTIIWCQTKCRDIAVMPATFYAAWHFLTCRLASGPDRCPTVRSLLASWAFGEIWLHQTCSCRLDHTRWVLFWRPSG